MQLPYDIVLKVLSYIPITRLRRTFIGLYPDKYLDLSLDITLSKLQVSQTHYKYLFKDFLDADNTFVDKMRQAGVVLIGMRAFSYFYPISLEDSYPWEFICQFNTYRMLYFIEVLSQMGVKWQKCETKTSVHMFGLVHYTEGTFTTKQQVHNIRLVCCSDSERSCMRMILRLPISAIQCVVSAYGAFDIHGTIHSKNQIRVLTGKQYITNQEWLPNVEQAMKICKSNNIQVWNPIGSKFFDEYGLPNLQERNLSDSKCITVYFSDFEHKHKMDKRTIKSLGNIIWGETAYTVDIPPNHLIKHWYNNDWFDVIRNESHFISNLYLVHNEYKHLTQVHSTALQQGTHLDDSVYDSLDELMHRRLSFKPSWMNIEFWNRFCDDFSVTYGKAVPF